MKRKIILIILTSLFVSSLGTLQNMTQADVPVLFSIALLSPNTSAARNQWSLLMEQQLPKIGIGVSFHESTGWGNIAPRTWAYPLLDDYIPTYAEGGYDILFVGWNQDLDWDPTGFFDTSSLLPYGDNFYQYSNPVYDAKLDQYLTELNAVTRIGYAHQLQAMLYDDLPAICLIYPRSLFGFKEGLTGIDGLLIASGNHRAEYWDDPDDHIIKYAVPADLKEPNIFIAESFYDMQWMQTVYGSLYKREQATHIYTEEIALNSTISPIIDNKINMTVFLDPTAKFSNGDPVLPSDVKYSYELFMTQAVSSTSYGYLTKWFNSNDSISIVGPDVAGGELLFELTAFFNFAKALLTFSIIDKSTVEPAISSFGYDIFNEVALSGNVQDTLVTSCGPFMLDVYDSVFSIVKMVPNPHWHGDAVKLTEWYLTFIAGKDSAIAELIAGNVDIVDAQYFPVLADLAGIAGVEGVLVKDPHYEEMAINMRHPILGTGELTPVGTSNAAKSIRKAISHAVPRETIVAEILEGLGAPGVIPCPDACIGFDESLDPYAYDLDLSRTYMELAGYVTVIPEFTHGYFVLLGFLAVVSSIIFYRKKNK